MLAVALPAWILLVCAALVAGVLPRRSTAGEGARALLAVAAPALAAVAVLGRGVWRLVGARAGLSHGAVLGGLCADVPLTPVAEQAAAWVAALAAWAALLGLVAGRRGPAKPKLLRRVRSGRARVGLPVASGAVALAMLATTGRIEGPGCGLPAVGAVVELPRTLGRIAMPTGRPRLPPP